MKLVTTTIPGVLLVEPRVFGDERGFLMETWNAATFARIGLDVSFVQDNHSRSAKGVLRGLHYQLRQSQGKLIRVTAGAVFDVAVDLRRSSASFGHATGIELTARSKQMLWIPPGFAHGFLTLEDDTDLLYKCTDFYAPEHERSLLWNDPALDIRWPLHRDQRPILSAKDLAGVPLAQAETFG